MNLLSVGISHATASVAEREKISMQPHEIRSALLKLQPDAVTEVLLLSTCNRTELFCVPVSPDVTTEYLCDFLRSIRGVRDEIPRDRFFSHAACGAITHFFEIASGVDSMIVGDGQILSQVREAYRIATEVGAAGPIINRLSHTAFAVGKRVRAETGMMDGAASVSYAAVVLAAKIFDNLETRRVLVLGAGETAELTVKLLAERGCRDIVVANRTPENAAAVVDRVGVGRPAGLDSLGAELPGADVVITSVAAREPVLTRATVAAAARARVARDPLFIVDIGVPRNVARDVAEVPGVFLHDLDALQVIVDQNMSRRRAEIPRARRIIDAEADALFRWLNALDAVPVIRALRERFDEARRDELNRFRHRFSAEQFSLVERMTSRMMRRLLHAPTVNLKGPGAEEGMPLSRTELIRLLFDLHPDGTRDAAAGGMDEEPSPPTESPDDESAPGPGRTA